MRLEKLFLSVLSTCLLVFLVACAGPPVPSSSSDAPAADSETPAEEAEEAAAATGRGAGEQLNILYWQAVSSMNPYLSGGTKEIEAASLVLEPLARYNEEGAIVPWLVEEVPTLENGGVSEDLTTITWNIRDGILWSDGTPFTAEDVAFTAQYCMDENAGCSSLSFFNDVEAVEALDELTAQITFSKPKPFPYGPFVGAQVPVIQKAQFADCLGAKAQECSEQNFAPVGTGSYQVTDFKANDVVVFGINENYREADKPFFKEVVFKGGGDAASAARSVLETGEVDYSWNLQVEPQILQEMEKSGKGRVIATYGSSVERLYVNFTNAGSDLGDLRSEWSAENPNPHPFLTDVAVRRALSLAIDRNLIAEQLYGSGGIATCNVVPAPAVYASPNNDECLTQNIEEAKAVLDEAGWVPGADGIREKDGVRLSVLYQTSTNSVRQSTQALIKQWWEEIGVETELRNVDAAVFFGGDPASPDTYGKFYADVQMFTNNFDGTDPESYMNRWICSNISSSANQWLGENIPRWCNAEYDELRAELADTAGIEARAEVVIQMNDMIVQDYVLIPLVHRGRVSGQSNTLEGVILNAWDSEIWNIADWTRAQ